MKAAIYARTDSKDDSALSQTEAMRKFATERGIQIAKEFVDLGISGTLLSRPALDDLKEQVKNKLVDTVIVFAPDRLSRNLSHLMILIEDFQKYGAKLCFATKISRGRIINESGNILSGIK